jgi:hypothetical protein
LVNLYQKHAGKQVDGDKFEAHFTTHTPGAFPRNTTTRRIQCNWTNSSARMT